MLRPNPLSQSAGAMATAEHRVRFPQPRHAGDKFKEPGVDFPQSIQLTAVQQHGNALGQQECGERVALLAGPQPCTAGSSLGPSTPLFHDRLWSSPSPFPSPFASLCLPL